MIYTDNYQLRKPQIGVDNADVKDLNFNSDRIDTIMHNTQISMATAYDATRTSSNPYNTGDIVMYEMIAYKCLEDGVYGTWDEHKWEQTTLADNFGGGDASEISYDNTSSGLTATDVQDAIDELEGNIEDAVAGLEDAVESLAPAYDSTETYNEGDIVSYENKLYECNTDNTTGSWDSQYWDEYTISEHMGASVSITPETIAEPKAKIADFTINGVSDSLYAPLIQIEGHASGSIASFSDGGDNKPLKSLKVAINPVQASGTPSPENPLPISGWTGANVTRCGSPNMWDEQTEKGTFNTTTGANIAINNQLRCKNLIPIKGNTTYYALCPTAWFIFYDRDMNVITDNLPSGSRSENSIAISNNTFTTPPNAAYTKFYLLTTYGTLYINDISINYPSTDKEYHAHITPTTYPISWSEEGEVFGGYIEFKDGEWKGYKTHYVETIAPSRINQSNRIFVYSTYSYQMKSGDKMDGLCDRFATVSSSSEYGIRFGASNRLIYLYSLMDNIPEIYDTASCRAWFTANPTKIYYPLETPIPFTLDSPLPNIKTLLGNNNIWSDTGEILECVYQRDLNLVINQFDERITALEQALNSSGTRSLSLSKSAVKEEETKEEEKEEEETKEEQR